MRNTIAALALAGLSVTASTAFSATWILDESPTVFKIVTVSGDTPKTGSSYSAATVNLVTGLRSSSSGKLDAPGKVALTDLTAVDKVAKLPTAAVAHVNASGTSISLNLTNSVAAAASRAYDAKIKAAIAKEQLLTKAEALAVKNHTDTGDSATKLRDTLQDPATSTKFSAINGFIFTSTGLEGALDNLALAYLAVDDAEALLQADQWSLTGAKEFLAEEKKRRSPAATVAEIQNASAAVDAATSAVKGSANFLAVKKAEVKPQLAIVAGEFKSADQADQLVYKTAIKTLQTTVSQLVKARASLPALLSKKEKVGDEKTAATQAVTDLQDAKTKATSVQTNAFVSVVPVSSTSELVVVTARVPGASKPSVYSGYGSIDGGNVRVAFPTPNYALSINGNPTDIASYSSNGVAVAGTAGLVESTGTLVSPGTSGIAILAEQPVDPNDSELYQVVLNKNVISVTQGKFDPAAAVLPNKTIPSKVSVQNGLLFGTFGTVPALGVIGKFGGFPEAYIFDPESGTVLSFK